VSKISSYIKCSLQGEDVREGNSPSWFNPVEVMQVVKYVQALVSSRHNLMFDDIGIITPYRKQVGKSLSICVFKFYIDILFNVYACTYALCNITTTPK